MEDIFKKMEFRAFSYEEDPEYIVDMHRCREVLEGGWFDDAETCRMHYKMIARIPGSSWVLSLCGAIFGYSDIIGLPDGNGLVSRWRLHPDYRHPSVTRKMFKGLCAEAKKRGWKGLVLYSDSTEVLEDLERIGIKRDRSYHWVDGSQLESRSDQITVRQAKDDMETIVRELKLFLGPPLSPTYVVIRAHMAANYGVFGFKKPEFYCLKIGEADYTACYDGKEWFVFRKERHDSDGEAVKPIVSTLFSIKPGRILLSGAAVKKIGLQHSEATPFWDFFTDKLD